jgi:hypothetical protein
LDQVFFFSYKDHGCPYTAALSEGREGGRERERGREGERERENKVQPSALQLLYLDTKCTHTNFSFFILALQLNTEAIPEGLYKSQMAKDPDRLQCSRSDQKVGGVP